MRTRIVIVVTLYALAVAFTVLAYVLYIPQYMLFTDRGRGTSQSGPDGPVKIIELYPEAPDAAKLRVGDEVVALDGESAGRDDFRLERLYQHTKPGEPYRMTLSRDGQPLEVEMRARVTPAADVILSPTALVTILYSLSFLSVGLAVFLLRPADKHALLLSLCFAALGESWAVPFLPFLDEHASVLLRALMAFGFCLKPFFPVFMLHLFLIFPRPLARGPRTEWLVYLPCLLLTCPVNLYLSYLFLTDVRAFVEFTAQSPVLLGAGSLVVLAYMLAFLVMDFIEGESLAATLRRERKLKPARAAEIFEQVLEGVGAAHRAGIVHRDLKPENILVSRGDGAGRERVRLLDFGLAKHVRAELNEAQTVTTPGVVMGTFGYMSPEQLSGGDVDERSDLFSAGVVAAEAIAGERPFKGRTLLELLNSMERDEFTLDAAAPEAARLVGVIRRALSKDPPDASPTPKRCVANSSRRCARARRPRSPRPTPTRSCSSTGRR
jgi:Protein kinase domain/PDZ domain